ncbi:hypothetical protein [Rhodoferax sp.]|uniref:hypothetical protein n=1 Tax=Rhodoferax sp. TaxID=50421 RepID=UPI002ACDF183|nr:hypothetical protein [Rhodoferax sp.]
MDTDVRQGEVVGLGGLQAKDRTELARLLFGLDPKDGGEKSASTAKRWNIDTPAKAIKLGTGLCPEDHQAESIIADLSVRENIALALQAH